MMIHEKKLCPKSRDSVPFWLSIVLAVYRLSLRCLSVGYGGMVFPAWSLAGYILFIFGTKSSLHGAIVDLSVSLQIYILQYKNK
jgi:hypothetical protein